MQEAAAPALGGLPALAYLAAAGAVYARLAAPGRRDAPLRESLLRAAVLCAAWLVLGTELLSLFRIVSFWPVLAWWLLLAGASVADLARGRRRWEALPVRAPRLEPRQWWLLAALAAPLAVSLAQALLSPPNNSDSLTYHLQRQVFWMQQGSVRHYPTTIVRQLAMPPLSEFLGLHLMLLSGGDAWHNAVQWAALALTALASTLLTRRLGGSAAAQLLAALIVAASPPAFLEASNTKNDLIVALFLCAAAHWTLELPERGPRPWLSPVLLGLSFGAVSMTKGTGVLFGLPLGGLAAWRLASGGGRRGLRQALAMAGLALALNAGHFARNLSAFGALNPTLSALDESSPLDKVGTGLMTPAGFASSLVKTLAVQCATPSRRLNDAVTSAVLAFHRRLGLEVNDPRTTFVQGGLHRLSLSLQRDEDTAGSPFHLLLLLLLPFALWAGGRGPPRLEAAALLGSALTGCLLTCALLRWARFNSRYLIPAIPLAAPVLAAAWASPRLIRALPALILGLLLTLSPSLQSLQRPLFGAGSVFRADPYAIRCRTAALLCEPAQALAAIIEDLGVPSLGFATGWSSEDYLLQRLLLDRMERPPRFMAFNAAFRPRGFVEADPAALVARTDAPRLRHESTGTWYAARWRAPPYTLYLPARPPLPSRGILE